MKSTIHFKNAIQAYLEQRAASDTLFAVSFGKPNKNIDDCVTYILNSVQKSGCNGFADNEIYSMAVHYYDEDDIDVGNSVNYKVVVNHTVELTEEEKEEARKEAILQIHNEARKSMTQTYRKPQVQATVSNQPNLFDE